MHPTDPAAPDRLPPPTPAPGGPPVVEVAHRRSSARHDAAVDLERFAAALDSIADRWSASRVSTVAELEQVRSVLAAAQAALTVLEEAA